MSSGVNRAILIGNLGADPELKTTATGKQVAEFRLATTRKWSDAQGQLQQATEWHRVKVWGRMADLVGKFLSKGRQVYVEGRIETRKWVDKEGHDRYTTEIVAHQVIFLGGGRQATGLRATGAHDEPEETLASEPASDRWPPRADQGETAWPPARRTEGEIW
jgi:single-strand DNA-binding protein